MKKGMYIYLQHMGASYAKHINKAMHHTSKLCGTVAKDALYQGAH